MASFSDIRAKMKKNYGDTEEDKKKQQEQRRQNSTASATSNFNAIRTEMNSKYKPTYSHVDDSFISTFLSDAQGYLNSAQSSYTGMSYSNRESTYEAQKKKVDDLRSRSWDIRQYLNKNKDSMKADDYSSFIATLDDFDRETSSLDHNFYRKKENYSQFDTEAAYNEFVRQQSLNSMSSEELKAAQKSSVKTQEDMDIIQELMLSNMPYNREYAEQDGRDMGLYDEVEKKRKYISDKYGIQFTESSFENAQLLTSLINGDVIAYTTADGQNVTWDYLHNNALLSEDLSSRLENYSKNADWAEKSKAIGTVADTASDYQIVNELARTMVPYDWETAAANGVDKATFDAVEKKRKYISDKYGVDLYSDIYSNVNTFNELMTKLEGQEGEKETFEYLSYLTDDEKAVLSYIDQTEGRAAALAWHNSRKGIYQSRFNEYLTTGFANVGEDSPFWGSVGSVALNLGSSAEYLTDIFNSMATGEVPDNTLARASSAIRSGVMGKYDLNWGEVDLFDFVYGTVMSGVDSWAAGKIGSFVGKAAGLEGEALASLAGSIGGTQLGLSAAGQATNDALDRGMSSGQAIATGIAAGIFEGLFEKVSIGKFAALQEVASAHGKDIAMNIVKSVFTNASEEFATEVANIFYDAIFNGDFSQYETAVRQYMTIGHSEKEAKTMAAKDMGAQIAESAASGALMGLGFGALGSTGAAFNNALNANKAAAKTYNIGKATINAEGGMDALQALAMDVTGASDSKLATKANKLDGEISTGEGKIGKAVATVKNMAKNWKAGQVYRAVESTISDQNKTDLAAALKESGFSEKSAKNIADAVVANLNGKQLTNFQKSTLELFNGNTKVGETIAKVFNGADSSVKQRVSNLAKFNFGLKFGVGVAPGDSTASTVVSKAKPIEKTSYEVSEGGKAVLDGTEVKLNGLRKMDDGSVMVATADDQTADPSDVQYPSEGHALIYENYANIETTTNNPVIANMDVEDRSALAMAFDHTSGVDAKAQLLGMNHAFWYGFEGMAMDEKTLPDNSLIKDITDKQRNIAYELGKKAAEKATNAQGAGLEAAYKEGVEKLGGEEKAKAISAKKSGTVILGSGIKESSMTLKERSSYEMAKVIAKSVGTNIRIYRGMKEYGKYSSKTGEIWLNINANIGGQSMMAFTLGHELVHMAKQWSPVKFKAFADYLLEQYGKKGISVEVLIREQISNAKLNGYTLDEHEAYEEVIADACQRMLLDSDAVQKMAAYKEKNPSQWQQIIDAIKEFIDKIRKAFAGVEPDSTEAALFKELDDFAKNELEKRFVDMVMDAGEHMSVIRNAFGKGTVVEVNADGEFTLAKGKDSNGATKFLYNDYTWEKGGRDTLSAALKAEGYSAEDIKAALTIMDGKHDLVKKLEAQFPEQARINQATITTDLKDGHSVLSALVSNGDYPVNIDLLMVCKKRKAYQRVINRLCETGMIQQATVDALAIAEINKILGKYGFETACLGCFVESRRLRIQEWANTIVKEWNAEVKKRNPNAKAFGFGKGEATLTQDEVMQLVGELEAGGEKNDQGNLNLGKGSAVKRMGVLLDKVPSLRKTLSVEDLITPDGLSSLRRYDSNLFSMVKSRYGSNSPKFVQEFNPYNHELAIYGKVPSEYKSLREYLYAIGGARMQSFSDFIVENWFDYCQIVADLAARKLPMHTYTKEIALAKLFGLTGIKINMSLIPDIDRSLGREFAGLTRNENGELELIWADKDRFKATGGKSYMQSINFADAIALQNDPRYSANVGTIAVGVSDKHILMMLDDNRIRMIIPYHSSGMNPIFADLMGTSYYKDYTMVQNTTVKQLYNSKGEPVSLKLEKEQVGKLTSGFEFNAVLQELGDARAAAEAYKDWCADASKHTITIKGDTYTAELTPKFNDFSGHKNYYKLLEDFNTYDCISEEAARQGDVQQVYPEDFDKILKDELTAQENHRQKQEANQSFDKAMGEIEAYLSEHTKADTVFYAEQHGIKLSEKDKKLGTADKAKLADLRKGMKNSLPKVDSEGRQLSAEQIEFFKDSVVRDADGKLLVVYHGTPNGSTTIFDKAKTSEINDMGQGIYFSTNKGDASSYMGKSRNKKLYSTYVNIKAPFVVSDNVKITVSEAASLLKLCDDRSLASDVYRGDVLINAKDGYITTSQLANTNISQQMTKILEKSGKYDGIIDETVAVKFGLEEGTKHIIALNSNQIKSIDNQTPTTNPDIRYSMPKVTAPTFYSQMAKVVDGVKQEKLGAASVVSMLRGNGVKAEEIKWSGIEDWLEGKKSVTKAELQEFVAGSMLQIEEEVLTNEERPYSEERQKLLDEYTTERDKIGETLAAEWKRITGEEFPIRNLGAGVSSDVDRKIIDINLEHKKAAFEGRLLAKLRGDLKEVIANNDDFGFDSWKEALISIHRNRKDFVTHYEMSTDDKAVVIKYCNALNAYNELDNKISDKDTDTLREIAENIEKYNRKIIQVRNAHYSDNAKHMAKWGQYKLKGGENYREILFKIPGSYYSNAAMDVHWGEREGVLAHARIQDLNTFLGKMLFVEEIQSDWHNEGHKSGYASDEAAALKKIEELRQQWNSLYNEMLESRGTEAREISAKMDVIDTERANLAKKVRYGNFVPDAPFADTYHEYVLKRLLRMAADEGYDSIGWTPAEAQMKRWNPDRKTNEQMGIEAKNPNAVAFEDGYRIEYDQDIPKFLNKYGKKWGTTVGKTVLDNGTEVWSMAITDSMKDSVLYDGQPKYSMPKKRTFTYNELVARGSITGEVIKSGDYVHMKAGLLDEDWLVNRVKGDCKQKKTKAPEPTYYAEVPDIGRNVEVTRDGILHGCGNYKKNKKGVLPPSAVINARITPNLVSILKTAIEVNQSRRGSNIDVPFSHIMLGVAGLENADGTVDYYGVRIEIEERVNQDPILVEASVFGKLFAVNANKISSPHAQVTGGAGVALTTGSFAYNIADLLKDVKKDFDDTFSVDVYRKLKMYRKKNDFSENLLFKAPNSHGMSPRQLLADAFDELVQTPKERELMDQYRKNISMVEDVQERLRKLRAEISKLTKDKGDKAKIAELDKTAKELAELIDKYDRKLLDLEASKPLKDVLARARSAAYQEAKQRSEENLKEYRQQVSERFDRGVEGRRKTEMRKKIRKVIRDLDKILNRGDKKRNVKEDMKDFVAEALASAEVLFTDNYTNEDIVRNGFGVELSKEESKYLEEARKYMDELANLPAGSYDAWQERQEAEEKLKSKVAYRMSKLKDAFSRERQRLNKAEVADVLGKLADAYAKLETSEYAYVNGAYHEAVYEYLKMLQEDVGGAKIKDMTLVQLNELYKAYTMVLTTVQNANKMFAEDLKQSKEELANRVMMEVYKAGGEHGLWTKGQLARNQASWNNTKPIYAAERTGSSTFVQLVKGLFKGQYNWATDMEEAKAFRQKIAEKHGFKNWDMEKTYKFTSSSGIEFELNLNQIMSLYAYAKREQAHDHLLKGGFVFGKNTEVVVTKNGIKRTYLNKSAKAHNISDEIMGEIIAKMDEVAPNARYFVDEMQEYLSTTMGDKGNDVSMRLYGVNLFMEKFYFPLRSAGQFKEKAKEAELKQQQGQISIANSGFTHVTKPKASNPVVLDGFTDVWANHVNEMSLYHSMVLPMEDFRRVYNYASPNMEGQEPVSVNSFIENAYGDAATGYFDQLYKELNGGAIVDPRENLSKQRIGKFKKAAVMLSNSVVVQQFSAIGRAYALIDPKYFIGPKVDKQKHAALWNEMKQYAPVAIIKEMGGFDTHTGLGAKDYLLAEEYGKGEKIKGFIKDEQYRSEIMGMLPAKADELTWCAIWEAVKRETKAKNSGMDVKSEEFLKKAGERFSEVIEKTQVYDSVLARSANMRSKQGLMLMLTAFMAEPTTTVNMIEDALRKGNKKYIARTFGATAASIILNNALASIVYAMRDDDEDETFLEKYFQAFASGMLDDINPMTYYPILKDIWSLAQGYDVERTDMAIYSDISDSVKKVVTLIAKHDPETDDAAEFYKEIGDALMGLLDAGASACGIPWRNVRRDLVSYYNTYNTFARGGSTTWNSFVDAVGGAALDSVPIVGLVAGKSTTDKLYEAVIKGDTEYANRLKGGYKDADAYSNAVRKALRDNDPRVKEAAQAQINGNPSERVRIAKLIIADGFEQDDVVRAINAEINALTSDDSSSSAKKEKGFYTTEDFAREIANGDQASANAAKTDIIRTSEKNGKTQEEAENSFASSATSELKELFLAGKLSATKAVSALITYCGETEEDALEKVSKWEFEDDHGFSYSEKADAYKSGKITADELKAILVDSGGMTAEEAEYQVEAYDWENQGYVSATAAAVREYNKHCATASVPKDVYLYIRQFSNNTENDKDANGKSIAYSAMKKVIAEINAQAGLTSAQKTAIARSLGWAEKNIQKYKTW